MKIYQQILIAAVPTLAALFFFSPLWVMWSFIIFGQAHFLITYLYQYRGGKINKSYWKRYLSGAALIALFLYVTGGSLPLLTIVTAAIFEVHFLFDELFLTNSKIQPFSLFAVLPLLLLYPVHLSDVLLHTSLSGAATGLALLCAAIYIVWALYQRPLPYGGLWVVFLGLLFSFVVSYFSIPVEKMLGSVILFHYARWYLFYGVKFWKTPRFLPYLRDVVLINGAVFALFLLYWHVPGLSRSILFLFFGQTGFYVWTLLHIASSVRFKDYRGFLPLWRTAQGS